MKGGWRALGAAGLQRSFARDATRRISIAACNRVRRCRRRERLSHFTPFRRRRAPPHVRSLPKSRVEVAMRTSGPALAEAGNRATGLTIVVACDGTRRPKTFVTTPSEKKSRVDVRSAHWIVRPPGPPTCGTKRRRRPAGRWWRRDTVGGPGSRIMSARRGEGGGAYSSFVFGGAWRSSRSALVHSTSSRPQ